MMLLLLFDRKDELRSNGFFLLFMFCRFAPLLTLYAFNCEVAAFLKFLRVLCVLFLIFAANIVPTLLCVVYRVHSRNSGSIPSYILSLARLLFRANCLRLIIHCARSLPSTLSTLFQSLLRSCALRRILRSEPLWWIETELLFFCCLADLSDLQKGTTVKEGVRDTSRAWSVIRAVISMCFEMVLIARPQSRPRTVKNSSSSS